MFSIERVTRTDEITVLRLTGRVTAGHNIQELARVIDDLNQSGTRRVIVDLTGAEALDSTGLGLVVMYAQNMKNAGGQLHLAGAHGPVAHTLQLCKVGDVIPLFATADDAARSLAKAATA